VVIGEGTALVGVEGAGNAATTQGLLEGEVEAAGIGALVVEGGDDQAGVIIDEGAEVGGQRLGTTGDGEEGPWGEVDHPEVVDGGHFEGLGRAAE